MAHKIFDWEYIFNQIRISNADNTISNFLDTLRNADNKIPSARTFINLKSSFIQAGLKFPASVSSNNKLGAALLTYKLFFTNYHAIMDDLTLIAGGKILPSFYAKHNVMKTEYDELKKTCVEQNMDLKLYKEQINLLTAQNEKLIRINNELKNKHSNKFNNTIPQNNLKFASYFDDTFNVKRTRQCQNLRIQMGKIQKHDVSSWIVHAKNKTFQSQLQDFINANGECNIKPDILISNEHHNSYSKVPQYDVIDKCPVKNNQSLNQYKEYTIGSKIDIPECTVIGQVCGEEYLEHEYFGMCDGTEEELSKYKHIYPLTNNDSTVILDGHSFEMALMSHLPIYRKETFLENKEIDKKYINCEIINAKVNGWEALFCITTRTITECEQLIAFYPEINEMTLLYQNYQLMQRFVYYQAKCQALYIQNQRLKLSSGNQNDMTNECRKAMIYQSNIAHCAENISQKQIAILQQKILDLQKYIVSVDNKPSDIDIDEIEDSFEFEFEFEQLNQLQQQCETLQAEKNELKDKYLLAVLETTELRSKLEQNIGKLGHCENERLQEEKITLQKQIITLKSIGLAFAHVFSSANYNNVLTNSSSICSGKYLNNRMNILRGVIDLGITSVLCQWKIPFECVGNQELARNNNEMKQNEIVNDNDNKNKAKHNDKEEDDDDDIYE